MGDGIFGVACRPLLAGRPDIGVAFLVVGEVSAQKVPSVRSDLSNTGFR